MNPKNKNNMSEVVKVEEGFNIQSLLSIAVEKNVPVESLERLMAMRRELKAEWSKEQYNKAMTALQGKLPIVSKKKSVKSKSGTETFKYAPLEVIVDQTGSIIADNGFSYRFNTDMGEKIVITCTVSHVDGHSEDSVITLSNIATEYMNNVQKLGATVTYGKRYAFCNAFGIQVANEDTDAGNLKYSKASAVGASRAQLDEIDQLIAKTGMTKAEITQKVRDNWGVSYTSINTVQAMSLISSLKAKLIDQKAV